MCHELAKPPVINRIKNLFFNCRVLVNKAKSIVIYDKAISFHGAKDYKAAAPLMIQAAELGKPDAMTVLGSMYLLGQGVKEDGQAAVHWLQKAIDAGYDGAVSILGMAYATGKAGVKVDIHKAREMLATAAEKGDDKSAQMLEMMNKGEGMFAKLKMHKSSKRLH